jgi:CHRD domain
MSNRSRLLVLAVVGVLGSVLILTSMAIASGTAKKTPTTFGAELSGYSETPALNSTGSGHVTLTIAHDAIGFSLSYAGLSGNPAAAHVHVGQPGVAGGVSFFFCGGGGKPACPAATSGTLTGTVTAADIVGPTAQGFAAGDFDSVVAAIQNGVTYANMHTAKFPAGEIRGDLAPADKKHKG